MNGGTIAQRGDGSIILLREYDAAKITDSTGMLEQV